MMTSIRAENPRDHGAVRAVHARAFASGEMASEPVEAVLVDWLRADGDVLAPLSLVAEEDGVLLGSVICSRGRIGQRPSVGLGTIGVLPTAQGRGIGSALMQAVIVAAEAAGEREIILLGDPAFYGRFGFEPASARGVASPGPWGDAYFQIRTLGGFDNARDGGPFRYAAAFDRLG